MTDYRTISNGTQVRFANGIDRIEAGTVNGDLLTLWDSERNRTVTYVPVFVSERNEHMYVNAENVCGVDLHSVKV